MSITETFFRPFRFAWAGLLLAGGLVLAAHNQQWSAAPRLAPDLLPFAGLAFAIGVSWGLAALFLVIARHGLVIGALLLAGGVGLAIAAEAQWLGSDDAELLCRRAGLILASLGASVLLPALFMGRSRRKPSVAGQTVGSAQGSEAARDAMALANLDRLTPEEVDVLAWCSAYARSGRFVGSIENSPVLASLHAKGILDHSTADRQGFVLVVRPAAWVEIRDLGRILASRGTPIPRNPPFRYCTAFAS